MYETYQARNIDPMMRFRFGRLDDFRYTEKPIGSHQSSKRILADRSLTDMRVSIDAATTLTFRVVHVDTAQPFDAHNLVERTPDLVEAPIATEVISGDPCMTRIETRGQSLGRVDTVEYLREMLEPVSERCALSRSRLQRDANG